MFLFVSRPRGLDSPQRPITPKPTTQALTSTSDRGRLRRGSTIRAGEKPATVTLGGYCRIDVGPRTALRVEGEKRKEQVFLLRGSVTCEVEREAGSFEGLRMRGEFSVEGRGPSWAHPAIAGGRLYLRYADNLYAFNIRDPSYTPPRAISETSPPPKKEPKRATRTASRPPPKARPKTPEELARRLWSSAGNYLANGAVELARRKLEEIVRKYPETKYGPMAKRKLRSLE